MENEDLPLADVELAEIQARVDGVWPGPWTPFVDGRDFGGGSDMIRVGDKGEYPDIFMVPEWEAPGPERQIRQIWAEAHYDFVAHARQDIPRLLAEVRRLRQELNSTDPSNRGQSA